MANYEARANKTLSFEGLSWSVSYYVFLITDDEQKSGKEENQSSDPITYELDMAEMPLDEHINRLHAQFKCEGPSEDYLLQIAKTGKFLRADKPLLDQLGEVDMLSKLFLRRNPKFFAPDLLKVLRNDKADEIEVKQTMFQCSNLTKHIPFNVAFLRQGGLSLLAVWVPRLEGNALAYTLNALRHLLPYEKGKVSGQLVDQLYSLLDVARMANVCREAARMLTLICKYPGGWNRVNEVAEKTAEVLESSRGPRPTDNSEFKQEHWPYERLINLLDGGDFDTQVSVLDLCVALMENAPTKDATEQVLKHWRSHGIDEVLQRQTKIKNNEFKIKLARFLKSPVLLSQKTIEILVQKNADPIKMKETLFNIRYLMVEKEFVDLLIKKKGVECIIAAVQQTEGNTTAYGLYALSLLMETRSSRKKIMSSLDSLIGLFSDTIIAPVCRELIALLVLALGGKDGWDAIHKAFKSSAKKTKEKAYLRATKLITSGDFGTQLEMSKFLFSMVDKAPNDKKKGDMVAMLNAADLGGAISETLIKPGNDEFRDSLTRLQDVL
eukprot:TRINITY_DN4645_c0_g1_i1.p1 TRINITY_DN4645_c0_g1~~TRINITY_DN4645_c0_g1_i1.p1  ORF type:complete len:552 (+),score=151.71 TRINITY_DN4645_c0_g1_i1:167-1822(+)